MNALGFPGTHIARAAGLPPQAKDMVSKLNNIHSFLLPEDKPIVRAARDKFATIASSSHIQPVYDKIMWKKNHHPASRSFDKITGTNLVALVSDLSKIYYDPAWMTLETYRLKYQGTIDQLAMLGGVSGGLGEITFDDIHAFYMGIEEEIKSKLASLSIEDLRELARNAAKRNEFIANAIDEILHQNLKFSSIINSYGITAKDILEVQRHIGAVVDADRKAREAVGFAYVRSQAAFTYTTSRQGSALTPKLSILGKDIPNSMLTWSLVEPNANVVIDANGTVRNTSRSSVSIKLKAVTNTQLYRTLLYEGKDAVTLHGLDDNGHSDSSDSASPADNPTKPVNADLNDRVAAAVEEIKSMKSKLDMVLPTLSEDQQKEAKETVLAQAVKIAGDVLSMIALNASKHVIVEHGTAKAALDHEAFMSAAQPFQDYVAQLNDIVKTIDQNAAPLDFGIKLDFGTVIADQADITIPQAVADAMKQAGISRVNVMINGIGAALSTDDVISDAIVRIKKTQASVWQDDASEPVSDVYEIAISGMKLVHARKQAVAVLSIRKSGPVQLQIPVNNPDKLDPELVVLAKLTNGNAEIVSRSHYDCSSHSVVAELEDLSGSFVALERKLTFADIAPVRGWAERGIAVVAAKGLLGGGDGFFRPDSGVTRAEWSRALAAAFGLKESDLPVTAGAQTSESLTRAEAVDLAVRTWQLAHGMKADGKDADAVLKPYSDGRDVAPPLKDSFALAVQQGLIDGMWDNKLDPNEMTTRAQAAVILYRLLQAK